MMYIRVFVARLLGIFRGEAGELATEIDEHLELLAEEYVRSGLTPKEARLAAHRDFGGVSQVREAWRDQQILPWLDMLLRDVRFAARSLRRTPSFTVTAVAALTTAVASTLLIAAAVKAVLLKPLPYRDPDGLVVVWTGASTPQPLGRAQYGTVEDWRRQLRSFEGLAVADPVSATLTDADGAEKIRVTSVSPDIFPLLGVGPVEGRVFSQQEADERQHVGLISDEFWHRRFSGLPTALGATIVIDGQPMRIVGVLPAGIELPHIDADVWQPYTLAPDWERRRSARGVGSWFVLGRLRAGVTAPQAQAEMSIAARAHDAGAPAVERLDGTTVMPFSRYVVAANTRFALGILVAAAICLWLIAVVNVTNLSLARTIARAQEIAIRRALGAGLGRIARQLIVEHVTLAAASGILAFAALFASVPAVRAFGPVDIPRLGAVTVDGSMLLLAAELSLVTGLLISIGPIAAVRWRGPATNRQMAAAGKDASIAAARSILVTVEVALAITLLAGAGLLVRSWSRLLSVDPGFQSDRVLFLNVGAPPTASEAARGAFYAAVLENVGAVPGVKSAAFIGDLFVTNDDEHVITTAEAPGSVRMRLRHDEASGDIFTTLGTPLRRGRSFSDADRAGGPRVAIVNETFARRVWSEPDPTGRRFKIGPESPWFTVVGVIADMRREDLWTAPIPQMFVPLQQDPSGHEILLVKTAAGDPVGFLPAVRDAVRRVDKYTPMYDVSTLDALRRESLAERRLQTGLLLGASIVALFLAAIGIYGLSHYVVVARSRDIGIRLAIGARVEEIVRMTVVDGVRVTLPGLAVGLFGAWLLARLGSAMLFDVSPGDPLALTAVSALLLLVALVAAYLPARRIARIDPSSVLRQA